MKRFIFILILALTSMLQLQAQSQYISNSRSPEADRKEAGLNGSRGVLVLSPSSDLVITVRNVPGAKITPRGANASGMYAYEIVVGSEDKEPKVEVHRRADVNVTTFVAAPKKNAFEAYRVELVKVPIDIQNQGAGNEVILDARYCGLEFTSSIKKLSIQVSPKLQAKIDTKTKANDNNIYITTVTISCDVMQQAKEKMLQSEQAYKAISDKLASTPEDQISEKDLDEEERLYNVSTQATADYAEMMTVTVSAEGTNVLPVSLEDLGPRVKKCYGILMLNTSKTEYVTECSAAMAQGDNFFRLRDYESAKSAFQRALKSKDAPAGIQSSIRSVIAQCDSCLLYQKYTAGALSKIKELKEAGKLTQAELAKYATSAAEFMKILQKYNPSDYYAERVAKLDQMIADLPLLMKVTITKWVNDASGFAEAGVLPNVEIWAYYGIEAPPAKNYQTDRRFMKTTSESGWYKKLGSTNDLGEAELQMVRKHLPKALLFRPVHRQRGMQIDYQDFEDLMRQSSGDYHKRQFRIKMFTSNP